MVLTLPEVLANLQPYLARPYRRVVRQWAQLDRAVDKRTMRTSEFMSLLDRLGITPGATVLVFSSMERLSRRVPGLRPLGLIHLLQQRLGAEGTLLMPTFSFRGRQRDYADQCATYDVWKTPSRSGLLPEVFRRMPDVIRSMHPTHSIAGWGRHAADLLAAHHLGTAFGPNSPMYKLQDHGGLVVGLGTRPEDTFTILHVPEELHPVTRVWAYEPRPRFTTITSGGSSIPYQYFVIRPDAEVDRFELRILNILRSEGVVQVIVERGLPCSLGRAEQVITRSLDLIDRFSHTLGGAFAASR